MGNDPANQIDPSGLLSYGAGSGTASFFARQSSGESGEVMYNANNDMGRILGPRFYSGFDVNLNASGGSGTSESAQEEPTRVYNNQTGNEVGEIKDNTPNIATVVDMEPSKEAEAKALIEKLNGMSEEARNALSSLIKGLVKNYDLASFENWYNNSSQTVIAKTAFDFNLPNGKIEYNGKLTTAFAEVSNNLLLTRNQISVGKIPNGTDFDVQHSPNSYRLGDESNKVWGIGIHLHPVGSDTRVSIPGIGPIGTFKGGFNDGDRTNTDHKLYRSITIDALNIYLYNRNGPVITIPRR